MEKLLAFAEDDAVLKKLAAIKKDNKAAFGKWIKLHQGTEIDDSAVFDVQSKRLHEYKRQQLNLLWIIREYQQIKAGKIPARPITAIFGAKAAPAYVIAKDIIHAILSLSKVIDADPQVNPYLKVVMIENYNVTAAEKLIPAADISEQITMDGANVEIAQLVGEDNIYTFGASSDDVIALYANGSYNARKYYDENEDLREAVDFLTSQEMLSVGNGENLYRLHNELVGKDWFMTFLDFEDYCETKERMLEDLADEKGWAKKALVNIAKAGFFSSDRTIAEYNKDIWHL